MFLFCFIALMKYINRIINIKVKSSCLIKKFDNILFLWCIDFASVVSKMFSGLIVGKKFRS